MNVLVVSTPGPGHVNPLVSLIEAFLAAGDRVVVAAGEDASSIIEPTDAQFRQSGHGEQHWFERLRAHIRGFPGDGLSPDRINHYFVPRLFGEVATADMIDDVLAAGRELSPDVVLFETYAFAGPLAAELLDGLGVHVLLGPMLPHEVLELANDAVSPLWRSFRADAPGYAGVYRHLTVETCPKSLETLELPEGEATSLRPMPAPEAGVSQPARPLVYVTLGSFFGFNLDLFRTVLAGLEDEPVDVVVTVGTAQDPAALAPVPPNVRVERFIPQAQLLPTCAAVVHHGGCGTTFGALAHGLPQLVIPQGADNFINATMLERAGAARALRPEEVTSEAVRDGVRRILREPDYRAVALGLAAEIAAMPTPDEIVGLIRARVATR